MTLFKHLAAIAIAFGLVGVNGFASAADRDGTVEVDGQTRSFVIHVPVGQPPSGGFPLILAFHGGGMQGAGMARVTGLDTVADKRRFVVVYPDGIDKHWNDGRLTIRNPQNDVGFVSALLDQLQRAEPVDAHRVYATGISNGALFVQRLGCELSPRIDAIAPVAGSLPVDLVKRCGPARKVAALQISGTADPIMPYDGGRVESFGGRGEGGAVESVVGTTALWARLNGCQGAGQREPLPPAVVSDPTRVVRTRFAACPANGVVTLLTVVGGGHYWPGGAQPYRPRITGQPTQQIDASTLIADFFLSLPPG